MKLKVDMLYNLAEILLDTDPENFITYDRDTQSCSLLLFYNS